MSSLDCSETVALFLYAYGSMDQMTEINTGMMTTEENFRNAIGTNKIDGLGDITPSPGDIFVWRSKGEGHTGIIYNTNEENGTATILEAIGNGGSRDNQTNIKYGGTTQNGISRTSIYRLNGPALSRHPGWKGYFRPKN